MARPIEFDRQTAIDQAMKLFWRNGYAATSIQDLLTATDLNRGSLYAAFGSKRQLFLEALTTYSRRRVTKIQTMMATAASPLAAIATVFQDLVEESVHDQEGYSCLLVNTILEMSAHDQEVIQITAAMMAEIEALFYQALVVAQAQNALAIDKDAQSLARFLMTGISGLRVLAQTRPARPVLEDVVKQLLTVLV